MPARSEDDAHLASAQPTGRALPASEPVREAEQLGLEGLAEQ